MTQKNSATQAAPPSLLGKRMLIGAGIGLILISIFLLQVNHPRPEWGPLWMVRPLAVVPLAGIAGSICYHIIDRITGPVGWKKMLGNILSLVIFIAALWLGAVLGLAGTLWH